MAFYAVKNGRTIGIFLNWVDCDNSVKGYTNALYKKFDTKKEADDFINNPETDEDPVVFSPEYYVYTDGACSNNGKKNALAGIGIYFGVDDIRNVSKRIEGKQTNNAAELSAIIESYSIIENDILSGKNITIVTDSLYSIKCTSSYGEKCSAQGWDKNIPNKELVKTCYHLYKDKPNVRFIHIKAHTNNTDVHSIGNNGADLLANNSIGLERCPHSPTKKIIKNVTNPINSFKLEKQRLFEQKNHFEKMMHNVKQDIINIESQMFDYCKQHNGHDMVYDTTSGMYEKTTMVCTICGFED
jgi:ribonuclease HI